VTVHTKIASPSCPIAVVGMGLVVPGADSPASYWELHKAGAPQFSEPNGRWPLDGYYSPLDREDRSYAARLGFVHLQPDNGEGARPGADRTTLWLRHAIKQALTGVHRSDEDNCSFVLGYTADGSNELLNALTKQSVARNLGDPFCRSFETQEHRTSESQRYLPHAVAQEAIAGLLPGSTETLVIDAACSSGLYAVDYGIRQIAVGRSGIAVCAGAFALGWRDMILFSKLHGLSKSGDVRPMDRNADGVLFADGAAVVVLKALDRARNDGDAILGVIAGSGVSCDGHGKAIYAPRAEGQQDAIQRAWDSASVTATEIDAIVAHATGTPLGDATELRVLGELFSGAGPVHVISPKSIVGHTGWCAGIVSLIHALLIMRHGRIPPQHRFSKLPEALAPLSTTLDIPDGWRDLPPRADRPRAIGVSAFGFGGTNAHLVLMDEHPSFRTVASPRSIGRSAVLLDWDAYLPGNPAKESVASWLTGNSRGPAARFDDALMTSNFAEMRVPAATLAAMDPGQLMALRAAARLRKRMDDRWDRNRTRIGVFVGHMGPTRNGVLYALRCGLGFLEEAAPDGGARLLPDTFTHYAAAVRNEIPASSEDSYPGLMPNLAAARVANVLDARGLNLLVDTGPDAFDGTLKVAATYLEASVIDFAIVLTVDANVTPEWTEIVRRSNNLESAELAEGVFAFMLGCRDVAASEGIPVIAEFTSDQEASQAPAGPAVPRRRYLIGEHAISLIKQVLTEHCPSVQLGRPAIVPKVPVSAPPQTAAIQPLVSRYSVQLQELAAAQRPAGDAFLVANSIVLTNIAHPLGRHSLPHQSTIFSTDARTPNAFIVANITEAAMDTAIADLSPVPNHVRLVLTLGGQTPIEAGPSPDLLALSDMAFLTLKVLSEKASPPLSFSVLLLDALDCGTPRPEAAIFTGLATGLSAEFPDLQLSVVATSQCDPDSAFQRLRLEPPVKQRSPAIFYEDQGRWWSPVVVPSDVPQNIPGGLEDVSVIVAAGGARGITIPILLEIARRQRPKIWLLGSQDLSSCPEWVFTASDDAFDSASQSFIREQLRSGNGMTPAQAAQKFRRYRDARATRANMKMLAALCGEERVRYLVCDVTDPSATADAGRRIMQEDPRIDLLLFAAGIERSAVLQRKKLDDFRRVRDTKVLGYANLKRAFAASQPRMWCNFGSVSSLVGLRGLSDYCAANAYLGAAACYSRRVQGQDEWTIGWPLWTEVGMGSEKKLDWTPITPREGVRFMLDELLQQTRDPYIAFLGPLEQTKLAERSGAVQLTNDAVVRQAPTILEELPLLGRVKNRSADHVLFEATVHPDAEPAFAEHRIDGYPTMPAMLAVDIAVQSAIDLAGGGRPSAIENIECLRFLRGKESTRNLVYRVDTQRVNAGPEHRIHVRFLSDVVTTKGIKLAEDVVHFAMDVVFGKPFEPVDTAKPNEITGRAFEDPYYKANAGLALSGAFINTHNLVSGPQGARASFHLPEVDGARWGTHVTPLLLLDAMARTGVAAGARGDLPTPAVITGIERIQLGTPKNDLMLQTAHPEGLTLTAFAVGPVASDGSGKSRCIASSASGTQIVRIEGLEYLSWKGRERRRAA
jgi:3-oxoacyl-(acyl-carrier-protein) synthase/NAD(P)-dependent dehydrogenase (short-subunit alcohol dehydrogenase family)